MVSEQASRLCRDMPARLPTSLPCTLKRSVYSSKGSADATDDDGRHFRRTTPPRVIEEGQPNLPSPDSPIRGRQKETPLNRAKELFGGNAKRLEPTNTAEITLEKHKSRRVKDTCNWIFELEEYLLWISGAGGLGKSILMSTMTGGLQEAFKKDKNCCARFFCLFDWRRLNTTGCYCTSSINGHCPMTHLIIWASRTT